MAPYRGRGRGKPTVTGRLARSGIRTRGGRYRKFDSQRINYEPVVDAEADIALSEDELEIDSASESDGHGQSSAAYSSLLAKLTSTTPHPSERPAKRRRLDLTGPANAEDDGTASETSEEASDLNLDSEAESEDDSVSSEDDIGSHDIGTTSDPYLDHFAIPEGKGFTTLVEDVKERRFEQKRSEAGKDVVVTMKPNRLKQSRRREQSLTSSLAMKPRLKDAAQKVIKSLSSPHQAVLTSIFDYSDMLFCSRTPENAAGLRRLLSLHVVNHVLKGRDRIIKNNSRLAQADDEMLELRDQGFTRPKVLILTETRQMCAKYAEAITELFSPEQQENKQRFNDSFTLPPNDRDMPDDFQELFDGNNDNNFVTTIKFTRKTLKYFSAFYQSDIILASPLGLRRIIEHEDKKKRDHDFLSSIEVLVIDQADAMQMQNWENVESVLQHLNLQPKQLRDCDVNRVRHWYLDGESRFLRQSIVLSAYLTAEMNRLYNNGMQSIAGKVKVAPQYTGRIQSVTGFEIKQTFSRFQAKLPQEDPDERFKFFTTSVLPQVLRSAQAGQAGDGTLIFIPSYFDFLRVRNFFAISTMTENISFGAIHDYSENPEQKRARSHFLAGRHSVLLYTQRAHHFFRLRIRGVKRVVMYGLPENDVFYREIVAGYIGSTLEVGQTNAATASVKCLFSKFDALKLERIVGTARVRNLISGAGDTFDFL